MRTKQVVFGFRAPVVFPLFAEPHFLVVSQSANGTVWPKLNSLEGATSARLWQ
jgi:hypothetical protein